MLSQSYVQSARHNYTTVTHQLSNFTSNCVTFITHEAVQHHTSSDTNTKMSTVQYLQINVQNGTL